MCLLRLTVVGGPSWRQRKRCFGAFVGLVVGCVGGVRTGLCAGLVLALSHGKLSKLTPVLKSPGVETMTGMVIAAGVYNSTHSAVNDSLFNLQTPFYA